MKEWQATYGTTCRRWYIPHIAQEVMRTAHHAGGNTYRGLCRWWYIPHITHEVIHTAHHAGGDTYRTSWRRWYIPHITQEVIHTAHHAGGDTYRTSCSRWYIPHSMQEVIYIQKITPLRGLQPWWSNRVFSTKYTHSLPHTHNYKHGISAPSVHFSSVLLMHF